ncbi:MAG: hypothetical protein KME12_09800 [Trichocoleus desertorum ATA4-8-CV12]|nr:hypothetical protein [Trichocoleus desertorum ATA4-8-CV12]
MASKIEQLLFGDYGTHAVTYFSLSINQVVVEIAPWVALTSTTKAVFEQATLLSVWASPDESAEEYALPWDIIEFDSAEQPDGRWKFALHCSSVELIYLANFPRQTNSLQ